MILGLDLFIQTAKAKTMGRCCILVMILVLGQLGPINNGQAQVPNPSIFELNKKLGKGINLGNALEAPSEGAWGVTLKEGHFTAIKKAGFDSVRLPVKWSAHAGKSAPYLIEESFAKRVDWAIDQALKNGLNIVVNVHHYDEMDKTPDLKLPRLMAIWSQIGRRIKDRPDSVYLEMLNEPHDKLVDGKWNEVLAKVLSGIRQTNPTRPIIIGPPFWNGIWALGKLKLPKDDNLIVTVHFYDPFEFTHQGASWVPNSDRWKGKAWQGTNEEKATLRASLEKARAWGEKEKKPIYLGEFGAYSGGDLQSRTKWAHFVSHEATRLKFSWAYWEFCSGFGAYDYKNDRWYPELRDALLD